MVGDRCLVPIFILCKLAAYQLTDAKRELEDLRLQAARSTNEKLRTLGEVGRILLDPNIPEVEVRSAVFKRIHSERLQQVVEETESLIKPSNDQYVDLFGKRYSYIRRFAPAFLATLTFRSHERFNPLLDAVEQLRELNTAGRRAVPKDAPIAFIHDAWLPYVVQENKQLNRRYYELATL